MKRWTVKRLTVKRLFAIVLCVILLSGTTVFARFGDVENNSEIAWARDVINNMADKGYIKGYEDGNFRPNQSVSRIESLILLSRLLGLDEFDNATVVDKAMDIYEDSLKPYNIPYEREIAFLLYNGAVNPTEHQAYISSAAKDARLQRHEAAILLTKLMGAEALLASSPEDASAFYDVARIPERSRPYVEYVREKGLMQGMGIDQESNKPVFDPLREVTRAQMAMMLSNAITIMAREYEDGMLVLNDASENRIAVSSNNINHYCELTEASIIRIDGEVAEQKDLDNGFPVRITYIDSVPRLIDAKSISVPTEFEGIYAGLDTMNGSISVVVKNVDDNTTTSYPLSSECVYTINETVSIRQDIKKDDYVKGYVIDGEVTRLDAFSQNSKVEGVVTSIDVTDEGMKLGVVLGSGAIRTYSTAASVSVMKNGKKGEMRDILSGDNVNIDLVHNRIVKITSESYVSASEGVIEEITLARQPKLTVKIGSDTVEYDTSSDIDITLDDGEKGTIYDLRVGARIKFKAESKTITSVTATRVASIDNIQGVISAVDVSFRFIKVTSTNAETGVAESHEILVERDATITQVGTQGNKTIENLKVGQTINAYGSNVTGSFRASTILIVSTPQ